MLGGGEDIGEPAEHWAWPLSTNLEVAMTLTIKSVASYVLPMACGCTKAFQNSCGINYRQG